MGNVTTLASGLTFPEAPRWHDGRLWFSDFYSRAVYALDLEGNLEKIVEVPHQPSGIGWLPGGDMLVVSMRDLKVMRWNGRTLSEYADLSGLTRFACNDMLVRSDGRAYVASFGFDPHTEEARNVDLIMLAPDGTPSIAATAMAFPNGMVTLDDERTLVVAESVGQCLTAFDMASDGTLSNRRVLARTDGCQPDGICVDGDGNILVTTMVCNTLVTFAPDGRHLGTRPFDTHVWAVASAKGRTFVCASDHYVREECVAKRTGRILMID